ncbi:MAG: glycosyltransferase [Thermoleophilaceae bacterium]
MARYLAYTSPARGHLYPIVPTLLELRDRGHDVHVRTLASELDALRALGLHAEPIAAAIEATPLADFDGTSMEEALAKALGTFAERARHEVGDLRDAIADTGPDALLVDITTVGAAALADATGLPWAQSIPLFQSFTPGPGAPPVFGLVPYCLAPEPGLEVLNGPRREVGLEPLMSPDDVWRAPLHLYYTAPPLEHPDLGFPPSFRFVGPGLWEPPAPTPPWLDDLPEPLVIVSASSEFQRDHALVETALLALAQEPVSVAVSTAAHDPAMFAAPANARLERWLPHTALLRRAACVVCHGGMGITQKTLAAGVPLCIVPFGRDQFEVGARVAALGAATCLPPDALNPDSLRIAVGAAIAMRDGARTIAEAFARAGGATAAAAALEALLAPAATSKRNLTMAPAGPGCGR